MGEFAADHRLSNVSCLLCNSACSHSSTLSATFNLAWLSPAMPLTIPRSGGIRMSFLKTGRPQNKLSPAGSGSILYVGLPRAKRWERLVTSSKTEGLLGERVLGTLVRSDLLGVASGTGELPDKRCRLPNGCTFRGGGICGFGSCRGEIAGRSMRRSFPGVIAAGLAWVR